MRMSDGEVIYIEVRVGRTTLDVPCTYVVEPGRCGWVTDLDGVTAALDKEIAQHVFDAFSRRLEVV